MSNLSSYVDQLKNEGYSDQYIKKYLTQYGYSHDQIEGVLGGTTAPTGKKIIRHEHHVSFLTVFFVFVILAGFGVGIYFFLGSQSVDPPLLDLELEPAFTIVPPGSSLGLTLNLINQGSTERFDAYVAYEIKNSKGIRVFSSEETFAVSTTLSRFKSFKAPDETGNYVFSATAKYPEDQVATASFSFNVVEETPPDDPVEDPLLDTSASNVIVQASNLASTQPGKAEELCLQLQESDRDDCLATVVKISRRAEFCKNMDDSDTRDNCYMSFIVEGQTYLCSNIVLESNKDYCNRIGDLQILAQYYQS